MSATQASSKPSKKSPRLTPDQRAAVRKALLELDPSESFHDRIQAAFQAAQVPLTRKPGKDGKYYPAYFPWIIPALKNCRRAKGGAGGSLQPVVPAPPAAAPAPANPISSAVDHAIAQLRAALAAAIAELIDITFADAIALAARQLTPTNTTHTQPVKPRVAECSEVTAKAATAAAEVHSTPRRGRPAGRISEADDASEDRLNRLTDEQLKDRIGLAKSRGDSATVHRCMAAIRRRDLAAGSIASSHTAEV